VSSEYEAGTCNINEEEQKNRYITSLAGFSGVAVLTAYSYFADLSSVSIPLILMFSFIGFMGFLQGRYSFCSFYGIRGVYHVKEALEEVSGQNRKTDLYKSLLIIFQSLILALGLTVILYLILGL